MADLPGNIAQDTHIKDLTISAQERDILRRLAARVAELSARPILHFRHPRAAAGKISTARRHGYDRT